MPSTTLSIVLYSIRKLWAGSKNDIGEEGSRETKGFFMGFFFMGFFGLGCWEVIMMGGLEFVRLNVWTFKDSLVSKI